MPGTDMAAQIIIGNTTRSIVAAPLMGTEPLPSNTVALLVETTWAKGNLRRARTREILEEPGKALTAAESRTDHRLHLPVTGVAAEIALAIDKLQAEIWDPETAALFPVRQAGARPGPAVHGVLPALVALVVAAGSVAAVAVAAGEGGDSLTKEG